jgi:hypothetical protein
VNDKFLLENQKDTIFLMSHVKKLSNEYPNFRFGDFLNVEMNEEASLVLCDLKKSKSLINQILKDFHKLKDPFGTINRLTNFFQDKSFFSGFQFGNDQKVSNGILIHNITRQIIQTTNVAARDLSFFILILENFKTQVRDSLFKFFRRH